MSTPGRSSRQERRQTARDRRLALERAARAREVRRARLWRLGAVGLLAAVLVAGLVVASRRGGERAPAREGPVAGAAATRALLAGIPQRGTQLGSASAPLTLIEFADLQCPFCREYSERVLPTLVTRYVRTGRLRLVFRNLAFIGPDSSIAAQTAAAAGLQNRLWEFVDLFYANQQGENTGYVTDGFLRRIAAATGGLDVGRALRDRGSPAVRSQLERAKADAARYGIDSTPSFLLARRGRPPEPLRYGSLTADAFTGPIDRALGR